MRERHVSPTPFIALALLTTLPLACNPAVAQEREPMFREEIEVTEVLLDVLVTDKKGRVVTGLGPEDFVVREGDKEFAVTSADFYGDPGSLGSPGEGRSDRTFIVFIQHDKGASPGQLPEQTRIARDLKSWVRKDLLPNDQVAVLSYDLELRLHLDFSRDVDAIVAAIDEAAFRRAASEERRSLQPGQLVDSPALFPNLPEGRELRRETRRIQQTLDLVARAVEGIVGRKNLILFSSGFGAAARSGQLEPDSREYRRMTESLNAANVAVYSLDVPVIAAGGSPSSSLFGTLRKVAVDTGGEFYDRSTNFLRPLREITADNRGYYLIGYESGHQAGSSGYQKVEVRTKDESLRVRARRGYRFGVLSDEDWPDEETSAEGASGR